MEEERKTREQVRREAQKVIEWLNEEFYVIPFVKRIEDFTGIPASLQAFAMLNYMIF